MIPILEKIKGHIENIVFTAADTGFSVARLKEPNRRELTTIVGVMPALQAGESVVLHGEWKIHPQHGRQFDVQDYETSAPSDVVGIQKYLESGLIKGIGPIYAKKIVETFQEETLNVIDNAPWRLSEVPGVGKKRIDQIRSCWNEQRSIRKVMIFLRSHNVSPAYAQKIYKAYGDHSIEKVTKAPYQLAKDIFGIGFKMADTIAGSLGFTKDSLERIEAGIEFVLWELSNEGHTCVPTSLLSTRAEAILEVSPELIESATDHAVASDSVIREMQGITPFLWIKPLYTYERTIAKELKRLLETPISLRSVNLEKAIEWVQEKLNINLAPEQKTATKKCLTENVHIVTGGPGTGKSTITNAILTILSKITDKILLCAPTGRAAKRLTQITRKKAFTIHGILEFDFTNGGFKRNRENPLHIDLLIVDEASMIDTFLMASLLRALPDNARVLFIGDIDQLPSVGPGNVLKDMIASKQLGVTKLEEIFRQAKGSKIITNAHRINTGEFPELGTYDWSDFHFHEIDDPEQIQQKILSLVQKEIPEMKHFDSINDIQVLAPMKKGAVGTEVLNHNLQETLNPSDKPFFRGGRRFHLHDKVMQIRNNYDKKVFNGDVGRIVQIDLANSQMLISFDDNVIEYDFADLDEISLAYAVSIHKYQGSECPCIVIPVHTCHFKLLHRNLLYTGVTRGKRFVVLVGTKKAIAIAINNDEVKKRFTGLQKALLEEKADISPTLPLKF